MSCVVYKPEADWSQGVKTRELGGVKITLPAYCDCERGMAEQQAVVAVAA